MTQEQSSSPEKVTKLPLSLEELVSQTVEKGYQITDLGQEVCELAASTLGRGVWKMRDDWKLYSLAPLDPDNLNRFWEHLVGSGSGLRPVNSMANHFVAGSHIINHLDMPNAQTHLDDPNEPVAESVSFVFVVSGEKDMTIYPNGYPGEAVVIHQKPGMLITFPMNPIFRGDQLLASGTYHEVPPQEADCTTITWELARRQQQ